jgi:hypothetical protein
MAQAESEDSVAAATVAVKSTAVAADAVAARERLRVLRSEVILVRDLSRAGEAVATLEQEVNAILGRARDALDELQPNFDKLKAWLSSRTFASAIFRAAWAERSGRLATEAESADRSGNRDRFKQVSRAARALVGYLGAAEKAVSDLGGIQAPAVDPDVVTTLGQLEAQRRDQLFQSVLAGTSFRNEAPTVDWATVSVGSEMNGLFEGYRRWQRESADFAGELAALGAKLRDGFGWSEGVDTDLAALARREQTTALASLGGAAAEWIRTARRLETLSASSDATLLRTAAVEPIFSIRLTAWRRFRR